jgi:protein-S-isoprenylcysteine O-methyltransferase Ste14
MDTLLNVFVGLHIIGIAALLGGFLTQLPVMGNSGGHVRFVPGMLYGALTMLVTGVALTGIAHADDHHPSSVKLGVKLAVLIVILGLVYVKRDEERVDPRAFAAVGVLTAVNIFIAVLWT